MDPNKNYIATIHALQDANREVHKTLGETYQIATRIERNLLALSPILTALTHLQRIDATDSKGRCHQKDQLAPAIYPIAQRINSDMFQSIYDVKGRLKKALALTSE